MPLPAHGRASLARGRWATCRDRAADESGAALVITAIMLVAFIGLAALAIDIASFYQAQRQAQTAADAGALAGADALAAGASAAAVSSTATTQANTNYPSTTAPAVTVNGSTVTVNVANTSPAYFGQIFGVTSANIGARAIASGNAASCATPGNNCYAVFAMDTGCGTNGVTSTAGNITVNGGVHSNGSISVNANNSWGVTTMGPGCTATTKNNDNFANPGGNPVAGPVIPNWPVDYAVRYPACGPSGPVLCNASGTPSYCTTSGVSFSFTSSPATPGIWCAYGTGNPSDPATYTGAISFSGSIGSVTGSFIGGSISQSAGGTSFTPYNAPTNAMLFYAAGAGSSGSGSAIYLNGGSAAYNGHMFAPNGTITIQAGANSAELLEAKDVVLAAGAMTITGNGPTITNGTFGDASLIG